MCDDVLNCRLLNSKVDLTAGVMIVGHVPSKFFFPHSLSLSFFESSSQGSLTSGFFLNMSFGEVPLPLAILTTDVLHPRVITWELFGNSGIYLL